MPRHLIATAIAVVTAASSLGAQAAGQPRAAALQAALRNLVIAQENYFVQHGTYTTDVAALKVFTPGARPADSIWVQVIHAGGRSWTGRAVHMGTRGKSCVIYVGAMADFPSPPVTDADSVRARNEGEPTCDKL